MLSYQEEKNKALEYMLNKFYKIYTLKPNEITPMADQISLEVYITPDCNQNCSYCYLCKHKEQLYPKDLRDPEKIIKNFRILLNYFIENKMNPPRFDLFSGEIWETQLGRDIFEEIYQAALKGFHPPMIVIPSNFTFVLKDDTLTMIEDYVEKLKDLGIRVCFSCSNDGWYLDSITRPFNDEEQYELKKGTQAYYDRIIQVCKKWDWGFHPMVSAHGIEHWQENFDWWMKTLLENNFNPHAAIMFLEVRNDDWTNDKIIHYLKYLNHSIEYMLDFFSTTVPKEEVLFMYQKWSHHQLKTDYSTNYTPLALGAEQYYPGCTIHRSIVVRLGDLAIVPCHRTSYDEFVGGHYKVENDKIVGVEAKNIQIMNQVWLNNMQGSPKCGGCDYMAYCLKGCFGSQFESTGDLFYPCETVCNLYKARAIFLYHKYTKLGILEENEDKPFKEMIEKIKDTEDYRKWTSITQEII